jgi:hypothetical protein
MLVGFQHYVIMLGTIVLIATILVPLMGGGYVSYPAFLFILSAVVRANTLAVLFM